MESSFRCFFAVFLIMFIFTNGYNIAILPRNVQLVCYARCVTFIAMSLSRELEARGFVHQCSATNLAEILDSEKRVVYHGIDPTADSAHAGNFVNWILLRHLVEAGHKVIFLVGGGTGRIGDPRPTEERELANEVVLDERVEKLKAQAEKILGSKDILFVNNQDWLGGLQLIDFLRDTGKHFTVNELVKKEAIAERLKTQNGISYTEFAYPLLQAYDYLELHRRYGCDLQVGGSDQWGNIVAGVDLVRRVAQKKVYALTQPLVIDKTTGKKFGKSEGNAVWLDEEKTSVYSFYQFWVGTSDENVIDYLKRFTFLPLVEINELSESAKKNPEAREAQVVLADEVTSLVHGSKAKDLVKQVSELLFSAASLSGVGEDVRRVIVENAPVHKVEEVVGIVDLLVASGLASSKREARQFVENKAISLEGEVVIASNLMVEPTEALRSLRRGKKKFVVLI